MKTYWNIDKNLTVLNEWQPNCWIQVTCPTDEDQRLLEEEFKIPDYFLSDISDTDERARYEYDDGWMLIILRIPYVKEIRSRTPYTTVPLGIIHKRDVTITVCYYETNMMIDFVSYQQKRSEGFTDYVDMTFRLFLSSAVWYLKRLKQINSLIEKAKRNLDHGVNNESLIGLSRLQDSLTYFITSIRGNENLLSKLKFKLQVDELDADLIYISIYKHRHYPDKPVADPDVPDSSGRILGTLLRISIPIALGSSVLSIINLVDTKLIMYRLQTALGYSETQPLARARKAPREHQTDGDLSHDLKDLRDGGRLHVAHALRITAVRARQVHEHECRRQRPDALRRADVVEHPGQLRRKQEHDQPEQNAEDCKRQPCNAEDLARLHGTAERVRLADHARERDRHARRGHGEKHVVDIVSDGKVSVSLVAEDVSERDLIDRAEDLDDHHTGRHDGRAVEIVLLAVFLQNALPPR
mgnify:CR=1 FL=1